MENFPSGVPSPTYFLYSMVNSIPDVPAKIRFVIFNGTEITDAEGSPGLHGTFLC
jgi:hypothetical protein